MRKYIVLHGIILLYSLSGVFSKFAAGTQFLSPLFCFYYGIVLFLLGVYALAWQQIIKWMPLTTAFSNKAAVTAWGLVWGVLFFQEEITAGKLMGIALVIVGILVYSRGEGRV